MDAPPDIRKRSSKEHMADLLLALKSVRARKAASNGMEHLGKNEWKEALDEFREGQELFEELKEVDASSDMLSMQGLCLFALEKMDEAADVMRRAIELKRERNRPEAMANDLLGLSHILMKKQEAKDALASATEAQRLFKELGLEEEAKKAAAMAKIARRS